MQTLTPVPAHTAPSQPVPPIRLEITRVIWASRPRVFDAWTCPEIVHEWFGPGNLIPSATLSLRDGGEYEIVMRSPATPTTNPGDYEPGHISTIRGTYLKIVPNEFIQFTWTGSWDLEETSVVSVALRDVAGGTELKLTHERFTSENSRERHMHGWNSSLAKLEKALAKREG